MNSIVPTTNSNSIPNLDRTVVEHAKALLTGERTHEGRCILRAEVPPELRKAITRHLTTLNNALMPGSHQAIAVVIGDMMQAFPSMRTTADEARRVTAAYVAALDMLPLWAIIEACGRITRGVVPGVSLDFGPSAARVHEVATYVAQPFRDARLTLSEVLRGEPAKPVLTEAERETMRAKFAALRDELSGKAAMHRISDLEANRARADELAAKREAVLNKHTPPSDEVIP